MKEIRQFFTTLACLAIGLAAVYGLLSYASNKSADDHALATAGETVLGILKIAGLVLASIVLLMLVGVIAAMIHRVRHHIRRQEAQTSKLEAEARQAAETANSITGEAKTKNALGDREYLSTPIFVNREELVNTGMQLALQRQERELPFTMFSSGQWACHLETGRAFYDPRKAIEAPAIQLSQRPLPGPCRAVDVFKKSDLDLEHIPLALGHGDGVIECSLEALMHIAKSAPTGGGKTSLSYFMQAILLYLGVYVIVANPHFVPVDKKGRDWRPLGRAIQNQGMLEVAPGIWLPGLVRRPERITQMLGFLATKEIDRRWVMQDEGDFSYKPMYLFIDEWNMVTRRCPEASEYLTEVLERGRAVEVCVDTNAQGFLVKDTDLAGSARENFNTGYHLGGNLRSGSILLDMPTSDITKLLKAEQVAALGHGLSMLRNNEVLPQAELVRVPYADNEFGYSLLGRAEDWSIKALPEEALAPLQPEDEEEDATPISLDDEATAELIGRLPVTPMKPAKDAWMTEELVQLAVELTDQGNGSVSKLMDRLKLSHHKALKVHQTIHGTRLP